MNYLSEERKNALASEYVLGTLHGRARIRFQALLMQHRSLRHALWQWESRLNTLGNGLKAIAPRPELWQKIQQQLGFGSTELPVKESSVNELPPNVVRLPHPQATSASTINNSLKWLTGVATAAALILAVLLIVPRSPEHAQTQIAVVQSEKAEALWSIELGKDQLIVTTGKSFSALPNHDYELWMVASDGRPPVSLGLLPKSGKLSFPRNAILNQVTIAALAVSLEPVGGSPNGQPTKVLYTAQIMTI